MKCKIDLIIARIEGPMVIRTYYHKQIFVLALIRRALQFWVKIQENYLEDSSCLGI